MVTVYHLCHRDERCIDQGKMRLWQQDDRRMRAPLWFPLPCRAHGSKQQEAEALRFHEPFTTRAELAPRRKDMEVLVHP